jgi:hypothetical protein
MLENQEDSAVQERLETARRGVPEAGSLIEAICRHPDPFSMRLKAKGHEFQARQPVEERPNRATLKIFRVEEGTQEGRAVVFFYKQSQVPFSRDRLSYGICMIPASGPEPEEVEEWLSFTSSGFHPDSRPRRLRQAFTFNVPE